MSANNRCQRLDEPPAVPHAVRASANRRTCIEALAEGWINPPDLCPICTRAFMAALDWVTEPVTLRWHRNYLERAKGLTSEAGTS